MKHLQGHLKQIQQYVRRQEMNIRIHLKVIQRAVHGRSQLDHLSQMQKVT